MSEKLKWRTRAKRALARYFEKHSFPRLALGLLLILTGCIGFQLSYSLHRVGLQHMGLRFPLALLGAYASFLGLMRLWVEIEQKRFDPLQLELEPADGDIDEEDPPAVYRESSDSWLDWLDSTPDLDFFDIDGEGCLFGIVIAAILGLGLTLLFTLVGAPLLLAEVFLDAFLVAALYRRLRIAAKEHWLGTALRKTWRTVLLSACLLGALGWALEHLAPGLHTLAPALRQTFQGPR